MVYKIKKSCFILFLGLVIGTQLLSPRVIFGEEIIETGNSESVVVEETTVNENITESEGKVTECGVEGGCGGNNQTVNIAEVKTDNNVDANTGNNNSIGESSTIIINSGTAVAIIDSQNNINSNTTTLDTGDTQVNNPSNVTEVNNVAVAENTNNSSSETGNNVISGDNIEKVEIMTSEAKSYVNVLNLINTNIVAGKIGIYFQNNFESNLGNLDLNQIWKKIQAGSNDILTIQNNSQGSNTNLVVIRNNNLAMVDNQIVVMANSGDNVAQGNNDNALIVTGDATAIANVVNLVNINLIGSRFFIGVINIEANSLGDIVLPPPNFAGNNSQNVCDNCENNLMINSQNEAEVTSKIETEADSGNNIGEYASQTSLVTGSGNSYSNNISLININSENSGQMMIMLNILGVTSGKVYNWRFPGSVDDLLNSQFFVVSGTGLTGSSDSNENKTIIENNNLAVVNNDITVQADSGNNRTVGAENSTIKTGNVLAVANLTNLVNLNIFRSNWFYGIINVVGNWNGNTVFAYPDLTVNIDSNKREIKFNDELELTVTIKNLGYDDAKNVVLNLNLPGEIGYLNDNSGGNNFVNSNKIIWKINEIKQKSQKSFVVKLKSIVNPSSVIEKSITATVETSSIESNLNNNSNNLLFKIVPTNNQNNNDSSETKVGNVLTPSVNIAAKNNVNNFVYVGDIVTFEIELNNEGQGIAKEATLIHEIYDNNGKLWKIDELYLGDIDSKVKGVITFGVITDQVGKYTSKTRVVYFDQNGKEYTSFNAETIFVVKNKYTITKSIVGEVYAAEDEYDVLGESCDNNDSFVFIPYLLLFLISSFWILNQTNVWLKKR